MVQIGEQESVVETTEAAQKESLLKKYDIPISHLDFTYINDCNNAKEMEQIVHILRSGEEGFYPDLLKCAENKLSILKPNSKLLTTTVPVLSKYDISKSEWENLSSDIQSWVDNINKNDKELSSFQGIKPPINNLPIRKSKKGKKTVDKKPQRIKSMDYDKWDKLDVDAEILKMDLAEERQKEEALKKAEEKEKMNIISIDPDVMTKAELIHASEQARIAGNESFKLGEFEEALQYYTNSLGILPTAAGYNNRAITNLKLSKYEDALKDCDNVLKLEPFNEKALLRKAVTLKHLQKYEKAIETLEQLIRINPNDTDSQKMIQNIRKKIGYEKPIKTVRLKIEDHSETSTSNKKEIETQSKLKEIETQSKPKDIERQSKLKENNSKKSTQHKMLKPPQQKFKSVLIPIQSTSSYIGPYYSIERLPIEIAEKFEKTTKKTHTESDDHVIDLNNIQYDEVKQQKKINLNLHDFEVVNENDTEILTDQYDYNQEYMKEDDEDDDDDFNPRNPYEFVKYWQAIKYDSSLHKHEKLLRLMVNEGCDIPAVLGNKMDGYMLTLIIKCLATRFRNKDDLYYAAKILADLTKVPRFDIMMLLLELRDREVLLNILNRIYIAQGFTNEIDETIFEKYYKFCHF